MLPDHQSHLAAADAAVKYAWGNLGLPGDSPPANLTPLNGNSNVVFRIDDSIIRVDTKALLSLDQHRQYLHMANKLSNKGVVVGPSPQFLEPIETPHGVVTRWPYVENRRQVTARDLGWGLRNFHGAVTEIDVENLATHKVVSSTFLPRVDAYSARANSNPKVASVIRNLYVEARDELLSYVGADGQLQSDLGVGVLHGDGHLSNVRLPNRPVLIDLDNMKIGPRELDLLHGPRTVDPFRANPWPTVARSWTQAAYGDSLARGYGYDVRDWGPSRAVKQLSALGSVLFLANLAIENREVESRLQLYLAEVKSFSLEANRGTKEAVTLDF